MSGRGLGSRNSSRGGRGNTKKSGSQTDKPGDKQRKQLEDYVYYIGSAKQASDAIVVTKYLINHIRETYTHGDDVASTLETKQPFDFDSIMPVLKMSIAATDTVKERENKQYEMLYTAEINNFVERKALYDSNMGNAYALLFGRCNKAMQNKIQSRTDFESNIKNDPIELLKAINEHAMSYQENKYEMSAIADAMRNMMQLRQRDDESLIDYTARFKSSKDILVSQIGGPIMLTKYVESMESSSSKPEKAKQKEAFEQLMAFLYIENSDKAKYGSLISGLSSQYSLGQDQYPKTITDASNVLSNHRFDPAYTERKKRRNLTQQQQQQRDEQEEAPELSFAQMEGKCYCCGKKGHKSPKCRHKDKPKSEWAINKTPEIVQAQNVMSEASTRDETSAAASSQAANNSVASANADSSLPYTWMGAQITGVSAAQQRNQMRDWILLDNQSSVDLFCNPSLVDNITSGDDTLILATNAGDLETRKKAIVPGYGSVWFDGDAITNVFSLASMEQQHRVTYDSAIESAFVVHTPRGEIRFKKGPENLLLGIEMLPRQHAQIRGRSIPDQGDDWILVKRKAYTKK